MNSNYAAAGSGLKTMFIGEIVILISSAVSVIVSALQAIGTVGVVAGNIVILVGLNRTRPTHPGYDRAFYAAVANIAVSVIAEFSGKMYVLGTVMTFAGLIVSFLMVYFICTASGALLGEKGDWGQAERGAIIWKLNAVCSAVLIGCTLAADRLPGAAVTVMAVVEIIAVLVAGVLYLEFLYKASESLCA